MSLKNLAKKIFFQPKKIDQTSQKKILFLAKTRVKNIGQTEVYIISPIKIGDKQRTIIMNLSARAPPARRLSLSLSHIGGGGVCEAR